MWFGRAAHLRGVARWLAEVAGGGGSVLGVEGETGSGKTELSRFAAAAARRLGFRVLGVGGSPFESGAAGQLVRRLCGTSDPDEVHRRVLAESRSGPVLLVVDDLQWCDPESAICLAFLARRLPGLRIGLLVCRLPGVAAGDPVPAGELFRDLPRDARIELGALDDGTADAVVAASLPAAPAGARAAVRRWTGNNPYLLAEVLAVLTRCGDPLPEVADVVPASVAAWLLRHLGGDLPVARALAVLPGEAGADEVARVAGMPVFEVEPALGRLVALGLVRRGRGAAFRQPLVRAAVLDTTPPAERVALVLRGARPLRDRDLVGYLLTSGVADHPEVCAPLTAAVRRVVAESTGGDRSVLLRSLLAHRVSVPARVEFLRLLAAAELDRSPTAALACLDEAAGLAADRRSLAVDRARALHLLDRGAEAVRALRTEPWSERVDGLLATLAAEDPDLPVDPARRPGPVDVAESPVGWALWVRARLGSALPAVEEAAAAPGHGPLRAALVRALRAEVLLAAGRLDEAAADTATAVGLLSATAPEDRRALFVAALPPLLDTLVERAEHDTAARLLTGFGGTLPARWHHVVLLAARGRLRHATGDVRGAAVDLLRCGRLLATWGDRAPHPVRWRPAAVVALLDAGRRAGAHRLAEAELAAARDPLERGRALSLLGRTTGGAAGLPLLAEATRVLAGTPGLDAIEAMGEHGRLLARLGRERAARARLKEACLLAEQAGARRLRDRFAAELRAIGGRVRGQSHGPGALTAGERRTARLAAAGRTNREIAEQLFVTRRAVEMHLTQVYRKLGITGRREIAGAGLDLDM